MYIKSVVCSGKQPIFLKQFKKNRIFCPIAPIVADTFKSAETTAKWEMELSDISNGKVNKEDFLQKIKEEINNTIEQYVRGGSGNSLGLTFAPKNV